MAKKRANPHVSPLELSQQTTALTNRTDELMDRLAALEQSKGASKKAAR